MKKWIVSLGVIGMFLFYSWHTRKEVSDLHVGSLNNSRMNKPKPSSGTTPDVTSASVAQSESTAKPTLASSGQYKDGTYTGTVADAFYGNLQVSATIQNGKLTNVQFLQAPNDRGTSVTINQQAEPILAQEAIQAQSANVNVVSGATDSSQAFIQSLGNALSQAKG